MLFLYFAFPFCYLLSYRYKIEHGRARFIAWWILVMLFVDVCFNTMPAIKRCGRPPAAVPLAADHLAFHRARRRWRCLRLGLPPELPTAKLLPVRDPRIAECLADRESSAA